MMWEDRQLDEGLEASLDRLGEMLAPEPAVESDFVSRVMRQIDAGPRSVRRPSSFRRRLFFMLVGAAACLVAAFALWRTIAAGHAPPEMLAHQNEDGKTDDPQPGAGPAAQPMNSDSATEPVMRTSTWSVVTESVVLEDDVPVRELLYREFERVEVLDVLGNAESHLVIPTKVMLLASEETY